MAWGAWFRCQADVAPQLLLVSRLFPAFHVPIQLLLPFRPAAFNVACAASHARLVHGFWVLCFFLKKNLKPFIFLALSVCLFFLFQVVVHCLFRSPVDPPPSASVLPLALLSRAQHSGLTRTCLVAPGRAFLSWPPPVRPSL